VYVNLRCVGNSRSSSSPGSHRDLSSA
jgi:hypothetical protein